MRTATTSLLILILVGYAGVSSAQETATVPAGPKVGLELLVDGLTSPVTLAEVPDGSGRIFIVDQIGLIWIMTPDGNLLPEPFLDLRSHIVDLMEHFDERGLLGLAFHPEYAENGQFFVYYSSPEVLIEGYNHTSHISEFLVSDTDPNRADPTSERILLRVPEPQFNHNAGTLAFGPDDGYLYISLGDGGNRDDEGLGHVEDWYEANAGGNGQDIEQNLLGNILRIDVDDRDPGMEYAIPPDNPFVGRDGLDEIFAYGFRNPYRFSFDMGGSHTLLVGDAGQELWEEVSVVTKGGNYGWNVKEGTHCFDAENPENPPSDCPETVGAGHPDEGAPLIDPVIEFLNSKQPGGVGLVVVGGYVYRGDLLPQLRARYIFGTWSASHEQPEGRVFIAKPRKERLWKFQELHFQNTSDGELNAYLLGFGQDLEGEVYVLTTDTEGPAGNTGKVFRLDSPGMAKGADTGSTEQQVMVENHPNPFNPSSTIRFRLPAEAHVTLRVYDLLGREVAVLADGVRQAGDHEVLFDASALPSGVYLYRLTTTGRDLTGTMILHK